MNTRQEASDPNYRGAYLSPRGPGPAQAGPGWACDILKQRHHAAWFFACKSFKFVSQERAWV